MDCLVASALYLAGTRYSPGRGEEGLDEFVYLYDGNMFVSTDVHNCLSASFENSCTHRPSVYLASPRLQPADFQEFCLRVKWALKKLAKP